MSVFGGIVRLSNHKLADMHGLVRAVVRTQTRLQVNSIMRAVGLDIPPSFWIAGIWSESKSLRESHVTDGHNGKVFVCGLWDLYVDEGKYEMLKPVQRKNFPGGATIVCGPL